MADRSATALLAMDDFVVLSHTEEAGEIWMLVETTADVAGCPSCGVSDVLGGRRLPLAKWLDRFDLPITHEPANYAVSRDPPVRRVFCDDISAVTTLLAAERFVDAAYRLVVTLTRRGSAPNRGKHNVPFAADVMASEWSR